MINVNKLAYLTDDLILVFFYSVNKESFDTKVASLTPQDHVLTDEYLANSPKGFVSTYNMFKDAIDVAWDTMLNSPEFDNTNREHEYQYQMAPLITDENIA